MHTFRRLYVFLALVIVLTILAFVVTKRLALAEEASPASILPSPSVTVIHPTPYSDVFYDQNGNSATIYQQGHGTSWYSQHDKNGNIVSQGYLFDPLPRPEPLTVPPYAPSPRDPFDYLHRDPSGRTRSVLGP